MTAHRYTIGWPNRFGYVPSESIVRARIKSSPHGVSIGLAMFTLNSLRFPATLEESYSRVLNTWGHVSENTHKRVIHSLGQIQLIATFFDDGDYYYYLPDRTRTRKGKKHDETKQERNARIIAGR